MSFTEAQDFVAQEMEKSGLPEDSRQYGFEPVSEYDSPNYLRWATNPAPGEGMAIRYRTWDGEPLILPLDSEGAEGFPYCRIKPKAPFLGAKYFSPIGIPNQLYIPHPGVIELARKKGYIAAIEGEKKALAAYLAGEPAVGVPGPWGGMLAGHTEILTPLFEEAIDLIGIKDLTVILVWDSDAAFNSDFARATDRYARLFSNRGITLKALVLTQETTQKVGVDDLILAKGKEEFSRLLGEAEAMDPGFDYHDLQYKWLSKVASIKPGANEADNDEFLAKVFRKGFLTDFTKRSQDFLTATLTGNGFKGVQRALNLAVRTHVIDLSRKVQEEAEKEAAEAAKAAESGPQKGRPKKVPVPTAVKPNHLYTCYGVTVLAETVGRAEGQDFVWAWDPTTDIRRVVLPSNLTPGKGLDDEKAMSLVLRRGFFLPAENQWEVVSHAGQFFRLEENRWHRHGEPNLRANIHKIVSTIPNIPRGQSVVDTIMKGLRTHWQTLVPAEGGPAAIWVNREWRPAPGEIVTKNCRIQIMDSDRKPFANPLIKPLTPGYFHASPIPVEYDERALTSLFQDTLDLFVPDPSMQGYLQEVYGVCLLDETAKSLFF